MYARACRPESPSRSRDRNRLTAPYRRRRGSTDRGWVRSMCISMQFDVRQRRVSALPLLKSDFVRFDQRQRGIPIRQGVADTAGVDNPQVLDAEIAKCDVHGFGRAPQGRFRASRPSATRRVLARISHQAASRRQKSSWFQEVDRDANDRAGCRLRWPCPRGSFGPVYTRAVYTRAVRAHAPSTVGPAMLSVASTRTCPLCTTGPKSSAIITAPGEKCGLVARKRLHCLDPLARLS